MLDDGVLDVGSGLSRLIVPKIPFLSKEVVGKLHELISECA